MRPWYCWLGHSWVMIGDPIKMFDTRDLYGTSNISVSYWCCLRCDARKQTLKT
jgi:hypothetical protein